MLDILAEIALDAWLLAQVSDDPSGALVDGRQWERTIGDLLRRPEFSYHQGPGTTTLFGFPPASGIQHEIDAAASGRKGSVILECKSQTCGVSKADSALFHEKTLDFYCARPDTAALERWWGLVVSSSPIPDPVRAFCLQLGLIVCDPARLPLPVVFRTAIRPTADLYLPETLLQEAVRMGEPAMMSMQERWVYDSATCDIQFKPRVLEANEIGDLLWLQDELGSHIIDLYDLYHPGLLETRTAVLSSKLAEFP